eukprot:CAMPEP_0172794676 /NCGR_PEP_ID=MMETSP1074-20121228/210100_1 /TAXON_ID=2916 /ORGANISM="Ceratium fusus, Strain PA161109" /LENGTH=65 /DNA_ID=CAMNT_0013631755 /DNA_START=663 /DNA_END=857 /DNA_ORIENTATION=-
MDSAVLGAIGRGVDSRRPISEGRMPRPKSNFSAAPLEPLDASLLMSSNALPALLAASSKLLALPV